MQDQLLLISQTTDPAEKAKLIADLVGKLPKTSENEDATTDYSSIYKEATKSGESAIMIAAADVLLADNAAGFSALDGDDDKDPMMNVQMVLCTGLDSEERLSSVMAVAANRHAGIGFYEDEAAGYFNALKPLRGQYPALDDKLTDLLQSIVNTFGGDLTLDD